MSGERELTAPTERRSILARCLGAAQRETVPHLLEGLERALGAGAQPFEVIAGSPHHRYGARITFSASSPSTCRRLEDACGLEPHPWGDWSWVGLRVHPEGNTEWKRYHTVNQLRLSLDPPDAAPPGLVPVMASLHNGEVETYYRLPSPTEWPPFAEGCAALVGAVPPATAIRPRPAADAFCLSVRQHQGRVRAVTIFADDRALPDEPSLAAAWRSELPPEDRASYDATLMAVRAAGRRPARGWHAMLAWAIDAGGLTARAVSLRLRPADLSA